MMLKEKDQSAVKKGNVELPTSKADLEKLIKKGENKAYKYSVEDFFRNPEKTRFQISPDGTYFSYMGPYENRMNLFVQKIGSDNAVRITSEVDRDIAGYGWANNNRLIYIKDSGGDENFSLFGVDIDGENLKELTPYKDVRIRVYDVLEDNEEEMIIGMNKENKSLFEPYRINIKNWRDKKNSRQSRSRKSDNKMENRP